MEKKINVGNVFDKRVAEQSYGNLKSSRKIWEQEQI